MSQSTKSMPSAAAVAVPAAPVPVDAISTAEPPETFPVVMPHWTNFTRLTTLAPVILTVDPPDWSKNVLFTNTAAIEVDPPLDPFSKSELAPPMMSHPRIWTAPDWLISTHAEPATAEAPAPKLIVVFEMTQLHVAPSILIPRPLTGGPVMFRSSNTEALPARF